MPDPLIRGAVVLRDGRYDVVWLVEAGGLTLLPILKPRQDLAGDVALDLADLVACAVPIAGAVIRARRKGPVAQAGYRQVGFVPGRTMCRVVVGLVKAEAEQLVHDKWSDDRRHRRAAEDRCVNLLA